MGSLGRQYPIRFMGKDEHLISPYRLEISGFMAGEEDSQPDISFYPTPPLSNNVINIERLTTFFHTVLEEKSNIVFLADEEVTSLLRGLAATSGKQVPERKVFFCSLGDITQLSELYQSLHADDVILVILSGTFNQSELLAAALSLPHWRKVFAGPIHGPLAEGARFLQFSFIPVEIAFARFWQQSELVYLPLLALGEEPALLEEGFHIGYRFAPLPALSLAYRLWRAEKSGVNQVIFLSVRECFLYGIGSILPLLDESGYGSKNPLNYKILSPSAFKNYSVEEQMQWKKDTVFFLIEGWEEEEKELFINIPEQLKNNNYLDEQYFSLTGSSLSLLGLAQEEALDAYLKKEDSPQVRLHLQGERLENLGGIMAFLHTMSCYNAWLRETDIMNDPPRVEIDALTWDFWMKRAGK